MLASDTTKGPANEVNDELVYFCNLNDYLYSDVLRFLLPQWKKLCPLLLLPAHSKSPVLSKRGGAKWTMHLSLCPLMPSAHQTQTDYISKLNYITWNFFSQRMIIITKNITKQQNHHTCCQESDNIIISNSYFVKLNDCKVALVEVCMRMYVWGVGYNHAVKYFLQAAIKEFLAVAMLVSMCPSTRRQARSNFQIRCYESLWESKIKPQEHN